MCLAGSNILEPLVFLDRIAISEIIIKIIYFYFPNSKSFIYENLIFRGALFIDFGTEVLSQAYSYVFFDDSEFMILCVIREISRFLGFSGCCRKCLGYQCSKNGGSMNFPARSIRNFEKCFTRGGGILILVKTIPKKVVIFDNHYYLLCGITQ